MIKEGFKLYYQLYGKKELLENYVKAYENKSNEINSKELGLIKQQRVLNFAIIDKE